MEVVNSVADLAQAPVAINEQTYSPSSVLHLFNNSLVVSQSRRLITVRGIYQTGRGVNYGSFFYDYLRDEASDALMTLVVPGLIRNRLTSGELILFQGFVARKVVAIGGRIELHIHLDSLLEKPKPIFSEDDLHALEIQQRKASIGYRDVEASLKASLIAGGMPCIVILVGKTAIIDADISHQLGEAATAYAIDFRRINLHSEKAILEALEEYGVGEIDVLAISRGGGENLEIFNSCVLAEACLNLKPHFITAIGHKDDSTLLQRIADRAFITPTALGQFLNELYNDTIAELQHSKAALIESITRQVSMPYELQLRTLNEKVAGNEAIHTERIALLNRQLEDRERMLVAQKSLSEDLKARLGHETKPETRLWLYVLIAALAGVLVGAFLG